MAGYRVAVAGATGAVGQEMLSILQERSFPVRELRLLASKRSAGKTLSYGGDAIAVEELTQRSFKGIDIALFSAGADRSKAFAPAAARAGAVVVDNSSAFRMNPNVPLVVPEINPEDIRAHQGIIANPNCTTIIMLMGLYPLRSYGFKRIVMSSYQAVSGAGAWAIEELRRQVLEWSLHELGKSFSGNSRPLVLRPEKFPHPIAFNLIPHIDQFQPGGYTKEEIKCLQETRKILHDPEVRVTATTVRVPVFRSHSVSVNLETLRNLSPDKARALIRRGKGVRLYDDPEKARYPMPAMVAGKDDCLVGRIRQDETTTNGLWLWVVGDQLRKGAALNAIQIAEHLAGKAA
ncbi:MAG: aspartate-semialdehyde dehydrogenase [bacterium]